MKNEIEGQNGNMKRRPTEKRKKGAKALDPKGSGTRPQPYEYIEKKLRGFQTKGRKEGGYFVQWPCKLFVGKRKHTLKGREGVPVSR